MSNEAVDRRQSLAPVREDAGADGFFKLDDTLITSEERAILRGQS